VALVLSVVDRMDGTGADAAVTGAGGGSTVTLYRKRVTGDFEADAWVASGSRTGDGAIAVDVDVTGAQFYWWYAEEEGGAVGNPGGGVFVEGVFV
jgi:hypothetical protein